MSYCEKSLRRQSSKFWNSLCSTLREVKTFDNFAKAEITQGENIDNYGTIHL